jgi:hypothetical protein
MYRLAPQVPRRIPQFSATKRDCSQRIVKHTERYKMPEILGEFGLSSVFGGMPVDPVVAGSSPVALAG